jgi:hypothetical protein
MNPQTLDEKLCFSTTPIHNHTGKVIGTGFYLNVPISVGSAQARIYLDSAKHVFEDGDQFTYCMRIKDKMNFKLEQHTFGKENLLAEPEGLDLVALDITETFVLYQQQKVEIWSLTVPITLINDNRELLETFPAVNLIMMYGYPTGLYDKSNMFSFNSHWLYCFSPSFRL